MGYVVNWGCKGHNRITIYIKDRDSSIYKFWAIGCLDCYNWRRICLFKASKKTPEPVISRPTIPNVFTLAKESIEIAQNGKS